MKLFLKYASVATGLQILLCAAAWVSTELLPRHNPVFANLIYCLYLPVIVVVEALGIFKGQSGLVEPILYGIPLGVLLYGSIIGLIFSYLKGAEPQPKA